MVEKVETFIKRSNRSLVIDKLKKLDYTMMMIYVQNLADSKKQPIKYNHNYSSYTTRMISYVVHKDEDYMRKLLYMIIAMLHYKHKKIEWFLI